MRSTKLAFGLIAISASLFSATGAMAAEKFGEAHSLAISAERLFGLVATSRKLDEPGASRTDSFTTINFLSHVSGGLNNTVSYSFARVAGDFFIIDRLSLGAAFGVMSYSASREQAGMEDDLPSGSGILFAPRVGYAFMFTPVLGIWPRGGITYVGAGADSPVNDSGSGAHLWALTLEVPFVINPVPHFGFHVGPTLDLGIGGSQYDRNMQGVKRSIDASATEFGLQAAMFGYF